MILAIVLLLLGFGLVIADVFFPSLGALSLMAGISLIAAVVLGFQESGAVGWTMLFLAILGLPVIVVMAFRVFPRTPVGRRMIMPGSDWSEHERAAVEHSVARFVGREGVALSPLRPTGIAGFDAERVDVTTRGEHLASGTPVRALRFSANRLVVEAAPTQTENPS